MNHNLDEHIDADLQRQLDRLVDDELSPAERRELLQSFDDRDGGWRQCALAFLEAQSWCEAASAMMAESPTKSPVSRQLLAKATRARPTTRQATFGLPWAVLAASVAIAFFAGRLTDWTAPNVGTTPQEIAADSADNETPRQVTPTPPREKRPPIQPTYAAASNEPRWGPTSVIPGEIEDVLDQLGTRVRRHHRLMPAQSRDGRAWMVPVEEVELVPVEYMNY